jgi:hypothetical protein
MSIIYRKSLKGIDEVAFKSSGLPLRLVSYLLAVDGEASVDQLAARYQNLPSLQAVLEGLCGQGFLEVAGAADNVVGIGQMRVGNGASIGAGFNNQPPPQQAYAQPQAQQPQYQQPPPNYFPELESYKSNMIRDVSALLGADSAPVINKIQGCRSKDELFSTMMGIKKIVTIYTNRDTGEKFGSRYVGLSA